MTTWIVFWVVSNVLAVLAFSCFPIVPIVGKLNFISVCIIAEFVVLNLLLYALYKMDIESKKEEENHKRIIKGMLGDTAGLLMLGSGCIYLKNKKKADEQPRDEQPRKEKGGK